MRHAATPSDSSPSLSLSERMRLGGYTVLVPLALLIWAAILQWLTGDSPFGSSAQRLLLLATLTLAALALAMAVTGLLVVWRWSTQARRSADVLMAAFARAQQLLPWYVLAVLGCTFGSALTLCAAEVLRLLAKSSENPFHAKTALGAALVAFVLAGAVIVIARRLWASMAASPSGDPIALHGHRIDAPQALPLWTLIEKVARKTQAPLPQHVIVGVAPEFFVSDHAHTFSDSSTTTAGERVLYLSLPLMHYLNTRELAATLAHELAHFAAGDTETGRAFDTTHARALQVLYVLAQEASHQPGYLRWLYHPAQVITAYFLHAFDAAFFAHAREREFAADQAEVRLAGADAMATSLLRMVELTPLLERALEMAWDDNRRGHTADVQAIFDRLVREHRFGDPRAHLQDRQARWDSTHPTHYQRLKAAGVKWNDAIAARCRDPRPSQLPLALGLAQTANPAATASAAFGPAMAPRPGIEPGTVATATAAETLQRQFTAAAQTSSAIDAERKAELEEWATQGTATEELTEHTVLPMLAAGALAAGMVLVLATSRRAPIWEQLLYLGFFAGALATIWVLYRRAQAPAITLNRTGLTVGWPGAEELLDWHEIGDITVSSGWAVMDFYSTMTVEIALADVASAPTWRSGLRTRYDRSRHRIIINIQGVQGWDAQQVSDLLHQYWYAGLARRELRAMRS